METLKQSCRLLRVALFVLAKEIPKLSGGGLSPAAEAHHRLGALHEAAHALPAHLRRQQVLERDEHAHAVGQGAVDFVLQDRLDHAVGDVFGLQHWQQARLAAGEHSRVDVVRADQRQVDVVEAVGLKRENGVRVISCISCVV